MKTFEVKVNRWDGGIVNDPRDPRENVARVVSNFDILTDVFRMKPYRDSESGDDAPTTSKKKNFCVGYDGALYKLYALGGINSDTAGEILFKGLTNVATGALADNTWSSIGSSAKFQTTGAPNFNLFVFYRKVGLIFGAQAGTHIFAFDPNTSPADLANTHQALTYTFIGQGLVHSKDDKLYIPWYNNAGAAGSKSGIARNNNGSWTNQALALPDHLVPYVIAEKGNYLAVGCAPADGVGNSVVYLWDRDASLATLSESIDWGEGQIRALAELDGVLTGISVSGVSTVSSVTTRFGDKAIFKYLSGNSALTFQELVGTIPITINASFPLAQQKINSRLYFMMAITLNGSVREGVWSVGRKPGQGFTIVHERTPNNDTALTSGNLYNFIFVGDYLFQSFDSSSTHNTTKTNDSASYTATAIYETKIFNMGNSSVKKKLLGFTIITQPLASGEQVVVKYKKDAETSYTTFLTHDTDDEISESAINIQSSGANLPEFKEIQFRFESTGGAVITGYKFKGQSVGKDIYDNDI